MPGPSGGLLPNVRERGDFVQPPAVAPAAGPWGSCGLGRRGGGNCRARIACSRSPIYVFTIPILAFTMSDLGVHVAPIHAFTFGRYAH